MKALITIIALVVVALGIWWFVKGNNADIQNNPAAAGASTIDVGSGSADHSATSSDPNLGQYQDKG